MSLEWKGDAVLRKAIAAAAFGIDQTMALCVVDAKSNYYEGHGLITSTLQGSIQMRPAKVLRTRVVGRWGSFDVIYAEHVEKGTGRMPGQGQMQSAADREYGELAARIRRRFAA